MDHKMLKVDNETLEKIYRKFRTMLLEIQDEFNMTPDQAPIATMMSVGAIIGANDRNPYVINKLAETMLNAYNREQKRAKARDEDSNRRL